MKRWLSLVAAVYFRYSDGAAYNKAEQQTLIRCVFDQVSSKSFEFIIISIMFVLLHYYSILKNCSFLMIVFKRQKKMNCLKGIYVYKYNINGNNYCIIYFHESDYKRFYYCT